MKKVLFITNVPSPYRIDFFNEFGKYESIDLSVLFLEDEMKRSDRNSDWFGKDYTSFTPFFFSSRHHKNLFKQICLIIKLLNQQYDEYIFGGYNLPIMLFMMVTLKLLGYPYSIEIDGALLKKESIIKYLIKRIIISSAGKWYSPGDIPDKFLMHYGADKNNIFRYPFTSIRQNEILTLKDFSVDSKMEYRNELKIKEKYVILAIGQFIPRKGFDVLLDAAISLPSNYGIYIIGGIAPEPYLKHVEKNGLTNVHFIDFKAKEELKCFYRAADIFVLPTREDIWGLVINEALANGLPVVTTKRCVAGLELVTNNYNGYIVDVDNSLQLTDAINLAIENSERLSANALTSIHNYTIESMAETHEKLLNHS